MRKSADRQRKRQSRAAAPKHPADPPRGLGSEPPRWSSSSRALVLPRSTACSGSTLDRSSSNCNDPATSTDLHTDLVLRRGILLEQANPKLSRHPTTELTPARTNMSFFDCLQQRNQTFQRWRRFTSPDQMSTIRGNVWRQGVLVDFLRCI